MYNLLSDKLDRFEREIRKSRNFCVTKLLSLAFSLCAYAFSTGKPYVHTATLKRFREQVVGLSGDVDKEMELRRKISAGPAQIVRDSSVLNSDTLKAIKVTGRTQNVLSKTFASTGKDSLTTSKQSIEDRKRGSPQPGLAKPRVGVTRLVKKPSVNAGNTR